MLSHKKGDAWSQVKGSTEQENTNHKRNNRKINYLKLIPRQRKLSFTATMDLEQTTADSLGIKLATLQIKRFRFHR